MVTTKRPSGNEKIGLRIDEETIKVIDRLQIPVAGLAAKVRYCMMRGIAALEKEKAERTK